MEPAVAPSFMTPASFLVNLIGEAQVKTLGLVALALSGLPFFVVSLTVFTNVRVPKPVLFFRSIWAMSEPLPRTDQEYLPPVLKLHLKPAPIVPQTAAASSVIVPYPLEGR